MLKGPRVPMAQKLPLESQDALLGILLLDDEVSQTKPGAQLSNEYGAEQTSDWDSHGASFDLSGEKGTTSSNCCPDQTCASLI